MTTFFANTERLRELDYTNLYVIRNLDSGDVIQVTNLDDDITVTGDIPAFWSSGTFLSSTASHSGLKLVSESSSQGAAFTIIATHPLFQRYFTSAATTRMALDIYRCDNLDAPDFTDDIEHMFYGEMSGYGFAGFAFTASFSPVSASFDKPIPNFFYQRPCNNDLYSNPGCTVNPASFSAVATITGFNRYARLIECTIGGNPSASFFSNGYLVEPITKSKITIVAGLDGTGTDRQIYSQVWIPELESIGANLTIYQGCAKTVAACKHFGNLANFRGFPTIPTKNPSMGGVV